MSSLLDKLIPNTLMVVFYLLCGALLLTVFGWWLWRRVVPSAVYYRSAGYCLYCAQEKRYRLKVYFLPSLEKRSKDRIVCKAKALYCNCEEK